MIIPIVIPVTNRGAISYYGINSQIFIEGRVVFMTENKSIVGGFFGEGNQTTLLFFFLLLVVLFTRYGYGCKC